MQSMLLGILSGLVNIIVNGLSSLLGGIFKLLFNLVVKPILSMLWDIIIHVISWYLYTLSTFLLKLIDFMVSIFRALAGISEENGVTISIGDKDGDILLQLIRNPDIQSAFLSMCIVGLFLLIITSVFQIIKVEYTTEGAKNAKGPILQKAFKGLANLMLLPLLVVFGIVLANQVLVLLDKATGGDEQSSISRTLFVTAASSAFYRQSEVGAEYLFEEGEYLDAVMVIFENAIGKVATYFTDSWGKVFGSDGVTEDPLAYSENQIKGFEENFRTNNNGKGGWDIYNVVDVSKYYEYSRINYIVLIIGGLVILKTFFYTSIGMIIRLYKCAILFVIAPAVIGMTPINEGGLSRWRTSFIGQVLSAYGTVVAVNLFLIIVKLFIHAEISVGDNGNLFGEIVGSHFLSGLIKAIMVIAGCLMIEQFAKEIGGYFGADDALGAGKGMSKQIGDTAMKGVQVAAMGAMAVASGGATLGGIASKIGSGFKEGGLKGAVKGLGSGTGEALGRTKVGKFVKDSVNIRKAKKTRKEIDSASGQFDDAEKAYDEQIKGLEGERKDAQNKILEIKAKGNLSDKDKEELKEQQNIVSSTSAKIELTKQRKEDKEKDRKEMNEYIMEKHGMDYKKLEEADQASLNRSNVAGYLISSVAGYAEQGKKTFNPFHNVRAANDKVAIEGSKILGDSFEASVERGVIYQRGKRRRDDAANRVFKGWNDDRMNRGSQLVMSHIGEETDYYVNSQVAETNRQLENILKAIQAFKNGDPNKNPWEDSNMLNMVNGFVQSANAKGANLNFDDIKQRIDGAGLNGKIEALTKAEIGLDIDPEAINKALTKAMKTNGVVDRAVLTEELKKVFNETGQKGNTGMLQAIEHIIEKVFTEINH